MSSHRLTPPPSPKAATLPSSPASTVQSHNMAMNLETSGTSHLQQRRHFLLITAVFFCAMGILSQIQNLASVTTNTQQSRQVRHLGGTRYSTVDRPPKDMLLPKDLFIPSLEFRRQGRSAYRPSVEEIQQFRKKCAVPAKELEWEWYRPKVYSRNLKESRTHHDSHKKHKDAAKHGSSGSSSKQPTRLLVGLFAGHDPYGELLETTAHLAKVYANLHPQTEVVVLQGTAFAPQGCTPPGAHTTLNKIRLLFHAIDHLELYDQVLLLDADALLTDLDMDITTLLPSEDVLVAAQPIKQQPQTSKSRSKRHEIRSGVTLWNLHHPMVRSVSLAWFEGAKKQVLKGEYEGDQRFLQDALSQVPNAAIQLLDQQFGAQGSVVQHFPNSFLPSWEDRRSQLQHAASLICEKHLEACDSIPKKRYRTE